MKKKYSIGFFYFACAALLVLTVVYQFHYRKAYEKVERLEAQLENRHRGRKRIVSVQMERQKKKTDIT